MNPEDRTRRARIAAYERWARTEDPAAATRPALRAFLEKFEKQVDPEGKLAPHVRKRMAMAARKAHYARMAAKRWGSKRT